MIDALSQAPTGIGVPPIHSVSPAANPPSTSDQVSAQKAPELTAAQKQALNRLHQASTQLEGVFLNMLFSAMRDTVPKASIFGKQSQTEDVFSSMLDQQRADQMAQSGSLGIAKVLENQLRASVLADPSHESQAVVPGEMP